jgi:hypothetical protein
MDDLMLYMNDLRRVKAMNFAEAYLVHTNTHNREHIIVDAQAKI